MYAATAIIDINAIRIPKFSVPPASLSLCVLSSPLSSSTIGGSLMIITFEIELVLPSLSVISSETVYVPLVIY